MARSTGRLQSLNAICKRLGLPDYRSVLAVIERREVELGRAVATRRTGTTGRVVVRVSEAALRRDVPELFEDEVDNQAERAERAQIAKVNRALAGLREQQEQVAQRLLDGHVINRHDPFRREVLEELRRMRQDLEMVAEFVKDWDTRLQRRLAPGSEPIAGDRTQRSVQGRGDEE